MYHHDAKAKFFIHLQMNLLENQSILIANFSGIGMLDKAKVFKKEYPVLVNVVFDARINFIKQ